VNQDHFLFKITSSKLIVHVFVVHAIQTEELHSLHSESTQFTTHIARVTSTPITTCVTPSNITWF